MKIEVVYVAYDGEKFDSPAECEEYENRAVSLMNEFNRHVLFLDMNKSLILCPSGVSIEEIMTWFNQAYGECSYLNINTELSNELISFINNDLGWMFPPNKVGLYKYDYYEGEWVSAD